jgi:hypothetical protein
VRGPGKEILARLNDNLQAELQISITETMLADHLSVATMDPELVGVMERINVFCED